MNKGMLLKNSHIIEMFVSGRGGYSWNNTMHLTVLKIINRHSKENLYDN